jgi:hypothetical protein
VLAAVVAGDRPDEWYIVPVLLGFLIFRATIYQRD